MVEPGRLVDALDQHPVDVLFSIANLRIIPDAVLAKVPVAINFHDGPLPGYAGLNVTNWALLAGEREHAITWHLMTADVDAGRIVATERFPIADDETAFSLNARCYEAALTTFPRVAAAVASDAWRRRRSPMAGTALFRRYRPAGDRRPADRLPTSSAPCGHSMSAIHLTDRRSEWVRLVVGREVYVVDAAHVHVELLSAVAGNAWSSSPDLTESRRHRRGRSRGCATVRTPDGPTASTPSSELSRQGVSGGGSLAGHERCSSQWHRGGAG